MAAHLALANQHVCDDNPAAALVAFERSIQEAPTAAAYAVFMGASSNTRYQVVNSLEAYGLPLVPGGPGVQTVVSSVVRTLNNVRAHAADATDTLPLTGSSTIH